MIEDAVVLEQARSIVPVLRRRILRHCKRTSMEAAAREIQRRGLHISLRWNEEPYNRLTMTTGFWYVDLLRSRDKGLPLCMGVASGATVHGALVLALARLEYDEARNLKRWEGRV